MLMCVLGSTSESLVPLIYKNFLAGQEISGNINKPCDCYDFSAFTFGRQELLTRFMVLSLLSLKISLLVHNIVS